MDLILITGLFLFGSYTYSIRIFYLYHSDLLLISRRTHTYSDSSYTILNLYLYVDGGTCPHTHASISLILVHISRRSYRAYAYIEVPLGITRLILILRSLHLFGGIRRYYRDLYLFLYFGSYACITKLILVLQNVYLCYRAYSCISDLIHVLRNLYLSYGYKSTRRYYRTFYLYKSTRRYYRTDTEVPVGTFRSLPCSFLYSYSLFRVLSYNCLTTRPIIKNE